MELSSYRIEPAPADRELPAGWRWLAIAALAATPLVELPGAIPGLHLTAKRQINLTLFDPLLWLSFAWLLFHTLRGGRAECARFGKSSLAAVWPAVLLLSAGLLSLRAPGLTETGAAKLAAKSLFQLAEYLLAAPLVFLALLEGGERWRNRALWGLCLTATAAVAAVAAKTPLAAVFAGKTHPYEVGGLLGNRNSLSMFLLLALPPLATWGAAELRNRGRAAWLLLPAVVLPLLAAYVCLTAWGLAALGLGVGIAYAAATRRGTAMLAMLALALCCAENAADRDARLRLLARSVQTYHLAPAADGQTAPEPAMRVRRWAANLNMILQRPATGHGLGQYQAHVSEYFGDIPTPAANTTAAEFYDVNSAEPMTFSWFYVTLAETGLAGGAALLLLLVELLGRACRGCALRGGVAGATAALIAAGLWSSPLARGSGPLLGLLLALSALRDDREPNRLEKETPS